MEGNEKLYGRKRKKKTIPLISNQKSENKEPAKSTEQKKPEISTPPIEVTKPIKSSSPTPRKRTPGSAEERRPRSSRPDRERSKPVSKSRDSKREPIDRPKRGRVRVSIIIPAYNEAENVQPLFKQFAEVIRNFDDWEVIYVDDGSTDETGKLAKQASSRYRWLKVVSHHRNQGLTSALNTGFKAARGSIFVFYPADLQYHPEDIPRMIAKIDRGSDIVTGWKQGKYNKRFVSSVYNKICRLLFDVKVHDLNSVKAFKKEVLDNITMRRDWHRYMVVLAAENDYRIGEVKVTLYPRKFGKSKFGGGRILAGVLDLFSVKFQLSFMKRPLRFFGTWGIIAGSTGFIIGLIALYLRFFTTHGSRTLLYLVILLVLSGLGLFALGFLAEVMVGLRDEINSLKKKR
ncbi:MAG: glycosyltransferase family 2 protein [candidate division Zixibacteria bacterium]